MIRREDVRRNPRLAGLVKRYHTWPVTREQNVGEHTWQVMRIYVVIFPNLLTTAVCLYILYHDVGEMGTGDVPSDVKTPALREMLRHMERNSLAAMGIVVPEISPVDVRRVKLCDMIEYWEYGREELARGNRFAQPICEFGEPQIFQLARELEVHEAVGEYMLDMSKKMSG